MSQFRRSDGWSGSDVTSYGISDTWSARRDTSSERRSKTGTTSQCACRHDTLTTPVFQPIDAIFILLVLKLTDDISEFIYVWSETISSHNRAHLELAQCLHHYPLMFVLIADVLSPGHFPQCSYHIAQSMVVAMLGHFPHMALQQLNL